VAETGWRLCCANSEPKLGLGVLDSPQGYLGLAWLSKLECAPPVLEHGSRSLL